MNIVCDIDASLLFLGVFHRAPHATIHFAQPIKMLIYRQTSAIMPLNAHSPKPYYYLADMNILSKFHAYPCVYFFTIWIKSKARRAAKIYS